MNITAIICDYASNTEDICAIRYEVFVDGVPIGTGRILDDGHIGRVAVLKNHRGLGIGKLIMRELVKWAEDMNLEKVWLSSQWHAHSFYLDLDFVCVGEIYKEAGIDHIKMFRAL